MIHPPVVTKQMKNNLQGKDFLQIDDFTKNDIMDLIQFAVQLKTMQKLGQTHRYLEGKTLAMIFEKSSTRTRVSFETGMYQLGGMAQFLSKDDMQLGNGETVADTAKVLSRYVDVIMIRTFGHDIVEELAENATVPVINGLTDDAHPCQVMADLMTIYEKKGSFKGLKLAFVGDGNNMSQSLLMGCAMMGIDCHVAVPEGYEVKPAFLKKAQEVATETGVKIAQTYDPKEAVKGADVIYTDVWTSMGQEAENTVRLKAFADYQVNDTLVADAKKDFLFMHCLPAKRGEEVTNEVIDGENSVVFDQAENRLHAQKAILASIV
jgi:ornithine carbamoyltransferase